MNEVQLEEIKRQLTVTIKLALLGLAIWLVGAIAWALT